MALSDSELSSKKSKIICDPKLDACYIKGYFNPNQEGGGMSEDNYLVPLTKQVEVKRKRKQTRRKKTVQKKRKSTKSKPKGSSRRKVQGGGGKSKKSGKVRRKSKSQIGLGKRKQKRNKK